MINIYCAICGKEGKSQILYRPNFKIDKINKRIFSARRIPDNIHYQINKCLNCGLIFSSPVFQAYKLKQLYKKSSFSYEKETFHLNETYFYYLKKFLSNLSPSLKFLDIGCGNGFFLQELYKKGIKKVYGIEPSKKAVLEASTDIKSRIKIDVLKKNIFPNDFFDVITCFQTFDHILDPNQFLYIVYKILKKDGMAFFILHDTEGLSVKFFGERSPIFDIEHIYLFNQRTLKKIFQMNRFKKIVVFKVKNKYPLAYWIKMSPFPLLIRKYFLVLLNKLKLEKLTITLNAGNMGVVAYK